MCHNVLSEDRHKRPHAAWLLLYEVPGTDKSIETSSTVLAAKDRGGVGQKWGGRLLIGTGFFLG